MKHLTSRFFLLIVFMGMIASTKAQELTNNQKNQITAEINILFEKSIKAGESLDIAGITANVSDTLSAGFIDNGLYYKSFSTLMNDFKGGVKGIRSQKLNIVDKKITVLSTNVVLLTASGNYSVTIEDGRLLSGNFAWTFVYSRVKNTWKIVHTHMSNPR